MNELGVAVANIAVVAAHHECSSMVNATQLILTVGTEIVLEMRDHRNRGTSYT